MVLLPYYSVAAQDSQERRERLAKAQNEREKYEKEQEAVIAAELLETQEKMAKVIQAAFRGICSCYQATSISTYILVFFCI